MVRENWSVPENRWRNLANSCGWGEVISDLFLPKQSTRGGSKMDLSGIWKEKWKGKGKMRMIKMKGEKWGRVKEEKESEGRGREGRERKREEGDQTTDTYVWLVNRRIGGRRWEAEKKKREEKKRKARKCERKNSLIDATNKLAAWPVWSRYHGYTGKPVKQNLSKDNSPTTDNKHRFQTRMEIWRLSLSFFFSFTLVK